MHVTIPDEEASVLYANQTGAGPFAFSFTYFEKADLRVRVGGVDIAIGAFTDAGNALEGGYDGGTITLTVPAAAQDVLITREKKPVRITDFSNGPISAKNLNTELDKNTAIAADVLRKTKNSILRSPEEIGDAPIELPAKATRANKVFTFDGNGVADFSISRVDVATVASIASEIQDLAEPSVVSAIQDLSPAEVIAALLALDSLPAEILALSAIVAEIDTLGSAPMPANITTVAGAISNVNTVAGAVGNISTVAGSIANVNLVGNDLALGGGASFILRAPQAAIDAQAAQALAEAAVTSAQGVLADVSEYVTTVEDTPVPSAAVWTFNPSTAVDTGTDKIARTAHPYFDGQLVKYTHGGGTAIGGLTTATLYYIKAPGANDFQLSASRGGAAINLTSTGAGTAHTLADVFSLLHYAEKARTSADDAQSHEVGAAEIAATIETFVLGSYANATSAWGNPNATANTSIYYNTTSSDWRVLGAASPAETILAQYSTSYDAILTALAGGTLPSGVIADQSTAEAGANNTKGMTPLRVAQAIAALAVTDLPDTIPNAFASTTLTIATGSITPTRAVHKIDTEGAAASDDLGEIVGTNFQAGDILRLSIVNASRVVRILAAGVNILLPGDKNIILSDPEETIAFRFDGTNFIYESGQRVWLVDTTQGAGNERYGIVGDPALYSDFGAELRVNRIYDRPKVDITSFVVSDPGDTPEIAYIIANGAPGAATRRDGPYPGAYLYSVPFDGTNVFGNYPHSRRNAQAAFFITQPTITEHACGGGISFATTREGTKTPIDRFWIAPDGGVWVGFRGTCEDNPALDRALTVTDGAITSGTATLTSATGGFTAADASTNRIVRVKGAGTAGADLVTTVAGYTNANTLTLTANASTTVSGAVVHLGVDAYNYSNPEESSAPSGYHNWNDDKVSYGAFQIICPDDSNGNALTFVKSGETGGSRGNTRFDFRFDHATNELKLYRVSSGTPTQIMAWRNTDDRVDFSGNLLVEGSDSVTPVVTLRNTSETGNKQYYALENTSAGIFQVGSGSSIGSYTRRFSVDETGTAFIESNETGVTGAQLFLYHNSSSPAVGDAVGNIYFRGRDSGGSDTPAYAQISAVTTNVTNGGTEAGKLEFYTRTADNGTLKMTITAGVVLGSPTGGDKGLGTLNAVGVYDDNTLLTDLVLDMAADGAFDEAKYANHPVKDDLSPDWFDPDWYADFWRKERRLPGMLTWEDQANRPAVGELVTRLTAVVEAQAVLIENLNQRLKTLENAGR